MRYRNHWYLLDGDAPLAFGMGIHGQNLFVDRANEIVIADHARGVGDAQTTRTRMSVPLIFAPLTRGEASGFCERGVCFLLKPTPRSPSAHDPLVRGSAEVGR